jgi:hypothetical protein
MPKRLPDRFLPDTIREFRAAARQRSSDAISLEAAGRRTGAIYLWGYVAEMTLKAAFFDVSGFSETQVIRRSDLRAGLATLPGVGGNPPLHHLGLWAQALVTLRAGTPGLAYADPTFGSMVAAKAQSLYGHWRETIRYRKNIAYTHEVVRVRSEAQWLLIHSPNL